MDQVSWIAVDWGTSRLRLWLMSGACEVIDERQSMRGMGSLKPAEFEGALLELTHDVLPQGRVTPVICCGMVGAAQGWLEAVYAATPCSPPGVGEAVKVKADDPRIAVIILPGVKQQEPADVMRGEETQISGFLSVHNGFSGCLCLPGTHTKWVSLSFGRIDRFQTCMSGELFALLSKQSVLRHSIDDAEMDQAAFVTAIAAMAGDPAMLPTELFRIRAASLVSQRTNAQSKGRLSGLLIGTELMAARDFWLDQPVRLIGANALSQLYQKALRAIGSDAEIVDATKLTLAGLVSAHKERTP